MKSGRSIIPHRYSDVDQRPSAVRQEKVTRNYGKVAHDFLFVHDTLFPTRHVQKRTRVGSPAPSNSDQTDQDLSPIHVTTALFFREDGTIIQRPYSLMKNSRRMVEYQFRVTLRTVSTPTKTPLSLSDPIHVTTALLYREDSTIDITPVLVNEDLWKELAPTVASGITGVSGNGHGPTAASDTTFGLNGKGSGLNFNALAFAPSSNAI